MAYPSALTNRPHHQRPQSMKDAISYEKVKLDPRLGLREIPIEAPPALKVQPAGDYRIYSEPDLFDNNSENIIASGTVLLIGEGGATSDAKMVGILQDDTLPGDKGVCTIEGLFLLQADPTISNNFDTLNGKSAYYDVDDGLVYASAGGTADNRLEIGWFQGGVSELEVQTYPISGYMYVSVYLDPSVMRQNTALSFPSDASNLDYNTDPYVRTGISSQVGLEQTLIISATSPNPKYQSGDLTLSVTVEGTVIYNNKWRNTVPATFTAGSGKTIVLAVTDPAGNTGNATYTVTISASAAPTALARS